MEKKELKKPVKKTKTSVDSAVIEDGIDVAIAVLDALPARTQTIKINTFEGAGGSFDGGGASGDWSDSALDAVSSSFSSAIDATGSVLSSAGDTIGDIAEGIGDLASGILGALD